ncbi:MAG: hypothetical protein V3T21_01880 [Candidatus Margulisiibacteriota bacterium]
MRKKLIVVVFLALAVFFAGCGTQESSTTTTTTLPAVEYNFNVAAAEGDLLTYAVDTANQLYSYNNITDGSSGSGSYTVNQDETFNIKDSSGNSIGTGMLLTSEVLALGIPDPSSPNHGRAIAGVPTLTASYSATADGVYNFVNSFGEYGTFEVVTANRSVSYYNITEASFGTGTYTDEGTGIIKYTEDVMGEEWNIMLLPGKVLVIDQPGGMTVGVTATTEYGSDLAGTYYWVDNEGYHGDFKVYVDPNNPIIGVDDMVTFEGTSSYGGGIPFTGIATAQANGSFLATQFAGGITLMQKDVIYLPGKVLAFNARGDEDYIGFGVQF